MQARPSNKQMSAAPAMKQAVKAERALARLANLKVSNVKSKVQKMKVKKETNKVKQMVHSNTGAGAHQNLLEMLMCTLTLPGVETTQRWSSPFSSKKTAVAEPYSIVPSNWGQVPTSTSSAYYQQMIQGETALFLFRNPLRAAIFYDQNGGGAQTSYQAQFDGPTGTSNSLQLTQLGNIPLTVAPEISYLNGTTAYIPHGSKLFCGAVTNHSGSYIWLDATQTIRVTVSCSSTTLGSNPVGVQLVLDQYGPEGFALEAYSGNIILNNTSPQTLTINSSFGNPTNVQYGGYYAPRFIISCNNGASNAANAVLFTNLRAEDYVQGGPPVNGVSHFCHLSLPYLSSNAASTRGIRITGLSAMYTNTSAEIQLGGTISGYQSGTDDNWLNYIAQNGQPSLQLVSSAQDSVTLNASRGMYGFMKPTDERDFEFKDDLVVDIGGNICDTSYLLDSQDSFVVMIVNNPNPTGCSGYYTFRYAIEYLTSDPWRSTGVSLIDESLSSQAIARIRDIEQFYENTTHWSDIFDKVKSVVSSVAQAAVKYGPYLLQGARMLL
jgi:hypothetical protein